ncbi:hypothetical protein D9619_005606 [Psilocybe cf. subviscida]|uniref:Defective in cullin neddylation protein n=1 Tax=Psilocybe cf. subviscida TaxID=2480587 RepID=A0A8H5FBD8_9AGAR|nr:hypothetical protein D9619_005606 [Psilocybe cf. subviscida]
MRFSALFCCGSTHVKSVHSDEEPTANRKPISQKVAPPVTSEPVHTAPATKAPAPKKQKSEPFTPARALALFSTYADKDEADVIGPEGYQQLCSDANMNLEGTQPLILAWQIGTSEMGKITKDEWVKWTNTVKISSVDSLALVVSDLDQLLMSGKAPAKATSKSQDYDKTAFSSYVVDSKGTFQKFYSFCFNLTKAPQSKNIEMETSVAMWGVLLVPKYPVMADVLQFISEKQGVYRGTNKDLWGMMLEFCESVSPDLHDFEADGAWPTLLDDFYGWKKAKGGAGNPESDGMAVES